MLGGKTMPPTNDWR